MSAEEPNFEAALQGYIEVLRKHDEIFDDKNPDKTVIDHPSKRKQMDIFMVRQMKKDDAIHHIVVELKNPKINLGRKQYEQVKEYMNVILSVDRFNDPNSFWDFYLVGNDFDSSGSIENEFENAKSHGEKSLAYRVKNYKIYVKRWSEIFNEFELRHNFLRERLELERHNLIVEDIKTADEIVEKASRLTSSQADPIVKSKKQRKNSIAK
ncbi:hypothetical protein VB774_22715 [Pseudanabaena galeata UHCC 0370]|uniref:Type I restriction enzyme R protein N-terminal domain-containing protein n=1 Tax=Pseudanabaena galeata UHCC 0370 TaxID=3110310 RepID=A0ABU5TQY7_9CYAN|nr:hypothetical protein [Pseudanabaena galeata]MEA5480456.1 hypothetical protein [Pseudanabaena galeata UHCC 0370]